MESGIHRVVQPGEAVLKNNNITNNNNYMVPVGWQRVYLDHLPIMYMPSRPCTKTATWSTYTVSHVREMRVKCNNNPWKMPWVVFKITYPSPWWWPLGSCLANVPISILIYLPQPSEPEPMVCNEMLWLTKIPRIDLGRNIKSWTRPLVLHDA